MSAQVPDIWTAWDYPALVAIHRELEAQPYGSTITTVSVLQRLDPSGSDDDRWGAAIDRLDRSQYIVAGRALWGRPYPMHISRVTERGLRAVGAWPSDRDPIQVMVQVLVAEAGEVEATEPERAGRLRQAADALGGVAKEVGTELAVKFAARVAGMP